MVTLRNRVHMFAHPRHKDALIAFFTEILGCTMLEAPGPWPQPILAFAFADDSSISVEFTAEVDDARDEHQARRGAWLELETAEPAALQQRILEAGCHHFDYSPGFFYFQIPGGQVMRIRN